MHCIPHCRGAPLWGYLADVHGRWAIILASAWTVLIASVCSALVPNIEGMLIARGIMGIGIGGIPVCFSLFMEYIPSDTRGMWGVIIDGIWWAVGSVAQAGLAYAVLPSLGWRWLLIISSTPLMLFVGLFAFFGRESPRYLLSKGRVAEAERLLDRMLVTNGKAGSANVKLIPFAGVESAADPPAASAGSALSEHSALVGGGAESDVQTEALTGVSSPQDVSAEDKHAASTAMYSPPAAPSLPAVPLSNLGKALQSVRGCTDGVVDTFRTLFTGPGMARLTSAVWVLWLANAMTYYGIVLLAVRFASCAAAPLDYCVHQSLLFAQTAAAVQDHGDENTCNGDHSSLDEGDFTSLLIQSAAEIPGTIVAAWAIDYSGLGRKWLQVVMFSVAAVAFFLIIPFQTGFLRTAILFVGRATTLGVFLVTYTYTPEVYPTHLRTTGFGLANGFGRIGGMIAPFIGQGLVQQGKLGEASGIFGAMCIVAALAASSLQVETAHKSLEDVGAPGSFKAVAQGFEKTPGNAAASVPLTHTDGLRSTQQVPLGSAELGGAESSEGGVSHSQVDASVVHEVVSSVASSELREGSGARGSVTSVSDLAVSAGSDAEGSAPGSIHSERADSADNSPSP